MDIYNGEFGVDFIKGVCFVDFGGDIEEINCCFYYGFDVMEIVLGDELYYGIVLGSGWCVFFLDMVVEDNFYMLKDSGVFNCDMNGDYIYMSIVIELDMYNVISYVLNSNDESE